MNAALQRSGLLVAALTLAHAFHPASLASEGTVQTRAGVRWAGHIRLSANQVIIASLTRNLIAHVPLTNLLELRFESPPALTPAAGDVSPDAWQSTSVGPHLIAGGLEVAMPLLRLTSGGLGIEGREDSFHWAHLPLRGDGEISGRLLEAPEGGRPFQAGTMFRENALPGARHVFLGWNRQGASWQWRDEINQPLRRRELPRMGRWLRLKRDGAWFLAYASPNGRKWSLVDQVHLELPETVHAGFALAGAPLGEEASPNVPPILRATFDQARFGRGLRHHSFVPRLTLRSGSQVVEDIAYADADGVRLSGMDPWPTISWSHLSQLDFQWVPVRWLGRLRGGRPGALLVNGEFFEGEPKQLQAGTFLFSTVLFGLRRFDAHDEIVSIVVRPRTPVTAPCEIRTWNGSSVRGKLLGLTSQGAWLLEPDLGRILLPMHRIQSITQRQSG